MNVVLLRVLLAVIVLDSTLAAGCGSESLPACSDVSWVDRNNAAELTGAPSFSASQITAGDPLSIGVPVSADTLAVQIDIQSSDGTRVGSLSADTVGGEIVELPLKNTDLPTGVYAASFVFLSSTSDGVLPLDSQYHSRDLDMSYILTVDFAAESAATCLTDIPVATFTVVSENPTPS